MPKGLCCNTKWILWVPGAPDSLFQGALFPVSITFPEEYPKVGPQLAF